MGLLTSHITSEFFLPAKHKEATLKSLKNLIPKSRYPENFVWRADSVLKASSFEDALAATSLETLQRLDGDIIELIWVDDEMPRDTYNLAFLLQSLAGFVRTRNAGYLATEQTMQHGVYLMVIHFLQQAANALPNQTIILEELALLLSDWK